MAKRAKLRSGQGEILAMAQTFAFSNDRWQTELRVDFSVFPDHQYPLAVCQYELGSCTLFGLICGLLGGRGPSPDRGKGLHTFTGGGGMWPTLNISH